MGRAPAVSWRTPKTNAYQVHWGNSLSAYGFSHMQTPRMTIRGVYYRERHQDVTGKRIAPVS